MTKRFYKFKAASYDGSLKDLMIFLVEAAVEAGLDQARVLVKYNKGEGIVTRNAMVFLPHKPSAYTAKCDLEGLNLKFWDKTEQQKSDLPEQPFSNSYVVTEDFKPCEFWLESTMSEFDSENVEFLFEFRKPENVLVGLMLELEKLTIYTSQADDLDRFNENLADGMSKTGLMKVMFQKSFLQATTCKEDSIKKMFAEYPRSQSTMSNNMKNVYLPNVRNQYGFDTTLNLVPSFNGSPHSVWEGHHASTFCKNYIQSILANNKVSYIGVNSSNVKIPNFDAPHVGLLFTNRFDPIAYLYEHKEAHPQTDLKSPFGISDLCFNLTLNIILTELENEFKGEVSKPEVTSRKIGLLIEKIRDKQTLPLSMTDLYLEILKDSEKTDRETHNYLMGLHNVLFNYGQCDYAPYIDALKANYIVIEQTDANPTEANTLALFMSVSKAEISREKRRKATTFKMSMPWSILNLDMSLTEGNVFYLSALRTFRKQGIAGFFLVGHLSPEPSDWRGQTLRQYSGTLVSSTDEKNIFSVKGPENTLTVNAEVI